MPTRIYIAHVLWNADYGGIQRLVIDMALYQSSHGGRPVIVFGSFTGGLQEAFEKLGLDVLDLAMRRAWSLCTERRETLQSLLLECDVVHVHDYNPIILHHVMRSKPGKIVYTEHGNFGIGRRLRPSERFIRLAFRRITRRGNLRLVYNSEFTKSYARALYGPQVDTGVVIYNGLDMTSTIGLADRMKKESSFRLLFLGRLVPQKGLHRFLSVLRELRNTIPELTLTVVGDGPERGRLEDSVHAMDLTDVVYFAGYQSDTDAVIAQADLMIIPSIGEPFGLVALEAMRMGVPIAVFADGGGVVEIAESTGEHCIASDAGEMVRVIEEYHARKRRGDLDPSAYVRVASEFSVARMCDAYDAVYASCLE